MHTTGENRWDIRSEIGRGPLPETIVCPIDRAEMVLVPEGSFTMGITADELRRIFMMDGTQVPLFATEIPARTISLGSYYIDRYPVTNYQYHRFVEDTGHREYLPMRGGCFLGSAAFVRVTCRWTPEDPANGAHWLGFRCVKEVPATIWQ